VLGNVCRLERDEPSDDDTTASASTYTASGKRKTAAAAAILSGYDSDDVEIQDEFGRDIIVKRGSTQHKVSAACMSH
jgi:hypothetical protein